MARTVVVMPAKDAESTVGQAVKSTLRAMPKDAQLLVVNDGSVDNTGSVLDEIRDRRLRVLDNDRSMGVAWSLNRAIEETDSEFLARMDADDLCLPLRFALQESACDGVDAVFAPAILFGRGRIPRPSTPLPISAEAWPISLLYGNPGIHSTFFGRREAVRAAGGYRKCLAEDYDLWLRMSSLGLNARRTTIPVLALRQHAGQVTRSPGWRGGASREPEWRESYRELVSVLQIVPQSHPALVPDQVSSPAQLAQWLGDALTDRVQILRPGDRAAIRSLQKRSARAASL